MLKLGSKPIALKKFEGRVKFSEQHIYVDGEQFALLGGKANGTYSMPLSGSFSYKAKVKAGSIPMTQLSSQLGVGDRLTGTMNADFDGGGGVASLFGKGSIKITKGKFYSIPLLGALRTVLVKKSSLFGGDVAQDLTASYTLKNGTATPLIYVWREGAQ